MQWAIITKEQKLDVKIHKLCVWHVWFAWRPIRITDENGNVVRIWLEQVGRKKSLGYYSGEYSCEKLTISDSEYCFKDDVLVNKLKSDTIYLRNGKIYEGC